MPPQEFIPEAYVEIWVVDPSTTKESIINRSSIIKFDNAKTEKRFPDSFSFKANEIVPKLEKLMKIHFRPDQIRTIKKWASNILSKYN